MNYQKKKTQVALLSALLLASIIALSLPAAAQAPTTTLMASVSPGQTWMSPVIQVSAGQALNVTISNQICANSINSPQAGIDNSRGDTVYPPIDLTTNLILSGGLPTGCWGGTNTFLYQANATDSYRIWVYNEAINPTLSVVVSYSITAPPLHVTVYNQATGKTSTFLVPKGHAFALKAPDEQYYTFSGWTGSGNGSYTGPLQNTTITVNGNITETAQYAEESSIQIAFDQFFSSLGAIPFQALVFDIAAIGAISLLLAKVVDIDPFQGKHLASILALFAVLEIIGFPFFYLSLSAAPSLFNWTGSWVLGNWATYPGSPIQTFLINVPVDLALPGLIVAAILLIKSSKKETLEPQPPHNPSHHLITAAYVVLVFLWLNGSFGTPAFAAVAGAFHIDLFSYGLAAMVAIDLCVGMITALLALPAYFFTRPATPANLSFTKPSKKVLGVLVPLAALAIYFSPSFALPSIPREVSVYGISLPILTSIVSIGLIVWRRRWLRQNGLALAAFVGLWLVVILYELVGGAGPTMGPQFFAPVAPLFIFLALPAYALFYRHNQSKTWFALVLVLSILGVFQVFFYLYFVYELVFNIKAVPSLKAPRMQSVTQEEARESLKEESKKEEGQR